MIQPLFGSESFTCPYCNTLAQQTWDIRNIENKNSSYQIANQSMKSVNDLVLIFYSDYEHYELSKNSISLSTCQACKKPHIWHNEKMLVPSISSIPMPSEDMPNNVKIIYLEARDVFTVSKKASAALLRLSIQHLCIHLGEKGNNINHDIKELVKKGLDPRIQKSLDILRITGNNAVHPGELNLEDDESITAKLFDLMNFITEKMITEPKTIDSFFDSMPEGAKKGIEDRDKTK